MTPPTKAAPKLPDALPADAPNSPPPAKSSPTPAAPDAGPAIESEGLDQLREDRPALPADFPGGKPPADMRKVARGVARRVDKTVARVTGRAEATADDIEEVTEMLTPAAEHYGARLGVWLWLVVAVIGLASLVLGSGFAPRRPELVKREANGDSPGGDSRPYAAGPRG